MKQVDGFCGEGLEAASELLADAAARAKLHLRPETITRTAARRLRASLAFAERLIRRLLVLLALEVELAPAAAPPPRDQETRTGLRAPRGFQYLPAERAPSGFLDPWADRPEGQPRNQTEIIPLLYRWKTLMALLEDPERAARHMARRLRAARKSGELAPFCWPEERLHRQPARAALVAGALPDLLNPALKAWFDSS